MMNGAAAFGAPDEFSHGADVDYLRRFAACNDETLLRSIVHVGMKAKFVGKKHPGRCGISNPQCHRMEAMDGMLRRDIRNATPGWPIAGARMRDYFQQQTVWIAKREH